MRARSCATRDRDRRGQEEDNGDRAELEIAEEENGWLDPPVLRSVPVRVAESVISRASGRASGRASRAAAAVTLTGWWG